MLLGARILPAGEAQHAGRSQKPAELPELHPRPESREQWLDLSIFNDLI